MANLTQTRRMLRREANVMADQMVRYTPKAIKLAVAERDYQAATDALSEALKPDGKRECYHCGRTGRAEPWAVQTWFRIVGAIDAPTVQIAIANFIQQELQARDPEEAVQLIESGKRFEQIKNDVEANWEAHKGNAIELLKGILQLHPEQRASIIAELGGVVPETNGGGH